jgi:hypothetical protein
MSHCVVCSKMLASLIGLTLVLATGADARSLMKRAADQLRNTREAVEKGGPGSSLDDPALDAVEGSPTETRKPAAAPAADPPAPPRIMLDRSQPWAAACEADARLRVTEHRPGAEEVTFAAENAKEWQDSPNVRGVEGKGEFLGWGSSRSVFSYRCRYDVEQGKVTWGRVTIGR